jgi:hypothetical protein
MKAKQNKYVISKSIELIKSFNSITHSIDTHFLDNLGDVKSLVRINVILL